MKEKEENSIVQVSFVRIEKDKKILLIQEKGQAWGLWCFPGGHVEKNETPVQAVIREVKEESGYNIKIIKKFKPLIINGIDYKGGVNDNDKKIELNFFKGKIISGEMKLDTKETLDIRWFSKDEVKKLSFRGDWLKPFLL